MEINAQADFETDVLQAEKPVLVYFFSNGCGKCRMQKPILKVIERDMADTADVVQVDIDRFQDLAERYQVKGTPTLVMFREGREQDRHAGVLTKEEMDEFITKSA